MFDPILAWNAVALEANRVSHTNGLREQVGPALSSRALGMVHIAMYNAFIASTPGTTDQLYDLGSANPTASPGSNANAAVAVAAHRVLTHLYPGQRPYLVTMLALLEDPAGGGDLTASREYGQQVADGVLEDRKHDRGSGSAMYRARATPGAHRPDPDNPGQMFYGPEYGSGTTTFSASKRFELAPPPFRNGNTYDERYLRALREVRSKGIKPELMGTPLPSSPYKHRDPNQTLTGLFWAYDGAAQLGTPPRLYNLILRQVAQARGNSPHDNARLFALVNAALADAGILAWEQKYFHEFWRPVVGIREHDESMGPGDQPKPTDHISPDCDTQWLPLGAPLTNQLGRNFTPDFPAYPSGHATFGAAALHMIRLFYDKGEIGRYTDDNDKVKATLDLSLSDTLFQDATGDDLALVSEECNGISRDNQGTVRPRHTRTFPRGLWQMIEENGRSRVYLGVHWVFDAFLTGKPTSTRPEGDLKLTETKNGKPYGGVPLGLMIAENIFRGARGGPQRGGAAPLLGTAEQMQNLTTGTATAASFSQSQS